MVDWLQAIVRDIGTVMSADSRPQGEMGVDVRLPITIELAGPVQHGRPWGGDDIREDPEILDALTPRPMDESSIGQDRLGDLMQKRGEEERLRQRVDLNRYFNLRAAWEKYRGSGA